MSVDTHIQGRNLAAYQRLRHPEYQVYVSPVLYGLVSRMVVGVHGRFVKRLSVDLVGNLPAGGECC